MKAIKSIMVSLLLVLSASTMSAMAQSDEFVISPENMGQMTYAGRTFRLWSSIRNTDNQSSPRLWQYRYEPLFLPIVKRSSGHSDQLDIRKVPLDGTNRRIILRIALSSDFATQRAFEAVTTRLPNFTQDLLKSNVDVMKIGSVHVEIPDLATHAPGATLVNPDTPFLGTERDLALLIDTPNDTVADQVLTLLPNSRLTYRIAYSAKTVKHNSVHVSYHDLHQSQLYAKLNGIPTTDKYIQRDDLRNLMEDVKFAVQTSGTIEDPEHFDAELTKSALATLTSHVSTVMWDNEKWASTYNGDDLKPDVVTQELNKMFSKSETESQWKYKNDYDASLSANVFQIVSGDAKAKVSYDDEGLKKALAQHDITVEFHGNKIVAKDVAVNRVNMAAFEQTGEFDSVMSYVSDAQEQTDGHVDLFNISDEMNAEGRLGELENSFSKLVGMIVPFAGPKANIPDGWVLCDGSSRPISGEFSPLFSVIAYSWGGDSGNFKLPNLTGRFLRGVDELASVDKEAKDRTAVDGVTKVGSVVGSYQDQSIQPHKHGFTDNRQYRVGKQAWDLAYGYSPNGQTAYGTTWDNNPAHKNNPYTDEYIGNFDILPTGDNIGLETRPKNAAVYWIIKYK